MSETEFKERKYQEKRNGNHSNGEKNFSNEKKIFMENHLLRNIQIVQHFKNIKAQQ